MYLLLIIYSIKSLDDLWQIDLQSLGKDIVP